MGIPLNPEDGWFPNKGLRIIGGGVRLELDWPELSSYPGFGLVRSRLGFDETLARAARRRAPGCWKGSRSPARYWTRRPGGSPA